MLKTLKIIYFYCFHPQLNHAKERRLSQMKIWRYMQDNLQGHLKGNWFLTFLTKNSGLSDVFMSSGTDSCTFGSRNDSDSVPW